MGGLIIKLIDMDLCGVLGVSFSWVFPCLSFQYPYNQLKTFHCKFQQPVFYFWCFLFYLFIFFKDFYVYKSSCKLGVNLALSWNLGAIWLFYNAYPQAAVVLLNRQFQKA